jgi:hypothetical protein
MAKVWKITKNALKFGVRASFILKFNVSELLSIRFIQQLTIDIIIFTKP